MSLAALASSSPNRAIARRAPVSEARSSSGCLFCSGITNSHVYFSYIVAYLARMGRWIFITLCILLLVAGTYWFLQKTGIEHCQQIGKSWDYAGWKCNTG